MNTLPAPQAHGRLSPGQHFTPEPVARFLWEQVLESYEDAPSGLRVIDPAAGEGALLMAASSDAGGHTCLGFELDPAVACNGQGTGVEIGDGLFDPPVMGADFDVALANPPYGRASDLLDDAQWERLLQGEAGCEIWGPGGSNPRRVFSSRPLEQLFVERCLALVGVKGRVGLILPDGLLANRRAQGARDWILRQAHPVLIVALPGATFRRPGLNAMAHLLVLAPRGDLVAQTQDCLIVQRRVTRQARLAQMLSVTSEELTRTRKGEKVAGIEVVGTEELAGSRWDAPFWHGRRSAPVWDVGWPEAVLGDFVQHITYGPIVPGPAPVHEPDGIASIRQGDFADWGLDLGSVLRVAVGGPHDPERSRVRTGDLLMPRSGAGALGRNRVGIYRGEEEANIGCFVDRIRLQGIDPAYVLLFLKSEFGWQQIRAVSNGVGTPNISFEEIRSLRIPVPSLELQTFWARRYHEQIESVDLTGADEGPRAGLRTILAALVDQFERSLRSPAAAS